MKTINYVPTAVGPTPLQIALSYAVEIGDVGKEKCCIITDIAKILKLLGKPAITTEEFFAMYDKWTVFQLELHNRDLQAEWNAKVNQTQPLQGQDF